MKNMKLQRFEGNPILVPDDRPWRNVVTFNPGAIVEDGVFYLVERACSSLVPFVCQFGLWKSTDGFHFEPEAFYEITGLVIPRVVFPSATVEHNGTLLSITVAATPGSARPWSPWTKSWITCAPIR